MEPTTTIIIWTAIFTTNPNDNAFPVDDQSSLYAGGAFLPNPTPGSDRNRRGIQMFAQAGSGNVVAIGAILLQPKSRGHAIIQDNDPLKIPLMDHGYLTDQADLETFKNTYKIYIKNIFVVPMIKIETKIKKMEN